METDGFFPETASKTSSDEVAAANAWHFEVRTKWSFAPFETKKTLAGFQKITQEMEHKTYHDSTHQYHMGALWVHFRYENTLNWTNQKQSIETKKHRHPPWVNASSRNGHAFPVCSWGRLSESISDGFQWCAALRNLGWLNGPKRTCCERLFKFHFRLIMVSIHR